MENKVAKEKWKGGTLLAPVPPVMVSCGTVEKPNIITIGWTGLINTIPPKTYISVRPSRFSYDIIKESGEFAINLTPVSLVKEADWCGIHTGRKVDKFAKCKLTPDAANEISAPLIMECPISLECKVFDIIPLGSHDMFLADIVAVNVAEELFDREGKIHMELAELAAFLHGTYYSLGERLDKIGCGIIKKGRKTGAKKPQKRSQKKT